MQYPRLKTGRLDILALTAVQLESYLQDAAALEQELGMRLSRSILTPVVRRAIRIKLDKMSAIPVAEHPWYTYWLVIVRQDRFGAGLAGYKGLGEGKQAVEIGYGIDPDYEGRGYTTEAAAALIGWAFKDREVARIITTATLKSNPASLRIQEKLGFEIWGEAEPSFDLYLTRAKWEKQQSD